jgi:hypothetical protein
LNTEEKKLTSSEIDELLKEAEQFHQPIRKKNNNRKKKSKIRIDMIIAVVVVVALVIGAVALISHFAKKSGSSSAKSTTENPLMDEKYPEISDVVKNYLNAYLIKDSQERLSVLAQYVDNLGDINEGDIYQRDYITGYSDVECYSKEGPYENTYVIYAYFEVEYKNISTKAPGIIRLYVLRDTNTGNVYIHNGVSSDIEEYMDKVTQDEDVQELLAEVNTEFEDALNSDEGLKNFYNKVNQFNSSSSETTAAQSETQTTATSETKTTAQQTTTAATKN